MPEKIIVADRTLARLGSRHGYRFENDLVHLNAMFSVADPDAHNRAWALQLWASPNVPAAASQIRGHLVTQINLPPIGELADDAEGIELTAFAAAPAGTSPWHMVLALVSGANGQFGEVHDYFVYPRTQQFLQPRITGNAAYRIERDRVCIEVEKISNPRDAVNSSGTLSLELWATVQPYTGGQFDGTPIAGVVIGALNGQTELSSSSFDLPCSNVPAQQAWHPVLMLREWTAAGYITRDFVNFPPVAAKIVSVPPAAKRIEIVAAAPAKPVEVVAAAPKTTPAPKAADKNKAVSVNTASVEELAAIKGLPAKVAAAIAKQRPFATLDGLLKVKGMGEKLLAKLRSRLKL